MMPNNNHFQVSQKIISLLAHTDKYPAHSLQKALHYLNQSFASGYDPTAMNYFLFNELIQKEGIPRSLTYPFLKRLVAHPKFIHQQDATHHPTQTLMTYLAGASYWFDKELFKEKSTDKNLQTLLDIGCILIQKGFQFPDLKSIQNPEIVYYMRTYIQKVSKRHQSYTQLTKTNHFQHS